MGNSHSYEVSSVLRDLAAAVRTAGDIDSAEKLEKSSRSRPLALLYREKLLSIDFSVEGWFQCWETRQGQKLSDQQVRRLAKLTKNWETRSEETDQVLKDSIANPSLFWGVESFSTEIEFVRFCLNDVRDTEEIPTAKALRPMRRRVSLLILYKIIFREMSQLKAQSRQRLKSKYLTSAIENILDKACRSQDISERTECRERCTRLQRYGKRWSLLKRTECILSPFENATDNFEQISIKNIEIEAIDAYEDISHDDEYRKQLQLAFKSICSTHIMPWATQLSLNNPSELSSSKPPRKRARKIRSGSKFSGKRVRSVTSSDASTQQPVGCLTSDDASGSYNSGLQISDLLISDGIGTSQARKEEPTRQSGDVPATCYEPLGNPDTDSAARSSVVETMLSESLASQADLSEASVPPLFDPAKYMRTMQVQQDLSNSLLQDSMAPLFDPPEYMQAVQHNFPNVLLQDSVPPLFDPTDYMQPIQVQQTPSNGMIQDSVPPLFDPTEYMQAVQVQQTPSNGMIQDSVPPLFDPTEYMQVVQVQQTPSDCIYHDPARLLVDLTNCMPTVPRRSSQSFLDPSAPPSFQLPAQPLCDPPSYVGSQRS
jgi:hypothetical protein